MGKLIYMMACTLMLLSGCQNFSGNSARLDEEQKEFLLSKVSNHQGLINIYRDKLKRRDNVNIRYRLSELYYQADDYEASRHYLKPLLKSESSEEVLLLETKNLLEQGQIRDAMKMVNSVLERNSGSGEAYNIRGILLAQTGDFDAAEFAFRKARLNFVEDDIVLNNLAMIAIMQEDYTTARDYLIPLYKRGQTNKKMLHNLVFVLVKMQEWQLAEDILRQNKMYENREGLMESLSQIKPYSKKKLQQQFRGITSDRESLPKKTALPLRKALMNENSEKVLPTLLLADTTNNRIDDSLRNAKTKKVTIQRDEKYMKMDARNSKEISTIRAGRHSGYFRIVLESTHAINFHNVPSDNRCKKKINLNNISLNDNIFRLSNKIAREFQGSINLSFSKITPNTVQLELSFNEEIIDFRAFRLPKNKHVKERLVFDIKI